jgi:hypothetical protein
MEHNKVQSNSSSAWSMGYTGFVMRLALASGVSDGSLANEKRAIGISRKPKERGIT